MDRRKVHSVLRKRARLPLRKKYKNSRRSSTVWGTIELSVTTTFFPPWYTTSLGQQISTKAQGNRLGARAGTHLGTVEAEHVFGLAKQICSHSAFRFARRNTSRLREKVHTGEIDLISIGEKPDEEVILGSAALQRYRPCGQRKKLLLFCLQRPPPPNVFS